MIPDERAAAKASVDRFTAAIDGFNKRFDRAEREARAYRGRLETAEGREKRLTFWLRVVGFAGVFLALGVAGLSVVVSVVAMNGSNQNAAQEHQFAVQQQRIAALEQQNAANSRANCEEGNKFRAADLSYEEGLIGSIREIPPAARARDLANIKKRDVQIDCAKPAAAGR